MNGISLGRRRRIAADLGIDLERFNRPRNTATPDDTVKIPTDGVQLEAMLQDQSTMAKVIKSPATFGEFVTNYTRHVYNRDLSIAQQVKDQAQREIRDWLKEHGEAEKTRLDLRPGTDQPMSQKGGLHNPRAMGAAIDGEFNSPSEYFRLIWHGDRSSMDATNRAKLARVRNAFGSSVPSEGGFLIPETLRSEMLRVSLETSIVRPRARVVPMESLRVPFPSIDASSNVSSVYGGIVGYWTAEGAPMSDSSPTFGRVVLEANKLTGYTEVPNELITDSPMSFDAFISDIYPEAIGFYEDDAFINGSGAAMPEGVLNASAMVTVDKEVGQPAASIVWENIVKMFSRMLPSSLNRAVWIASIDTFPELATMALSVGTGGSAIWLNNGAAGPPMTILGRPVIFTEKCPTLGTAGDLAFVDFGFYLIGDRQVMSATSSPHFKFSSDVTAYRIISRVDGRPWLKSAIAPKNGGSSLSPYVQLQTRS